MKLLLYTGQGLANVLGFKPKIKILFHFINKTIHSTVHMHICLDIHMQEINVGTQV